VALKAINIFLPNSTDVLVDAPLRSSRRARTKTDLKLYKLSVSSGEPICFSEQLPLFSNDARNAEATKQVDYVVRRALNICPKTSRQTNEQSRQTFRRVPRMNHDQGVVGVGPD